MGPNLWRLFSFSGPQKQFSLCILISCHFFVVFKKNNDGLQTFPYPFSMFLCEVFPLLPAGDTISTPVGLVALWLISSYIFGCRKTNGGRKKENVKMREKNKVQCFYEGHQCTRRLPFHMITRKLLHIFHGSCLFRAAIDQACCDLAPLFPLTNWVPVCFQMSDCNRIVMCLSLRQRSYPVATRSPSQ